jgi:hypothetical protein
VVDAVRVLVTGSRGWDKWGVVYDQLDRIRVEHGNDLLIVHGDCPTGADSIAESWAWDRGMEVEPHAVTPANWKQPGRTAGPKRNAEMVALGADVCLAFIGDCTSPRCDKPRPHPSHGATGCADLAEKAGIPVRRFT